MEVACLTVVVVIGFGGGFKWGGGLPCLPGGGVKVLGVNKADQIPFPQEMGIGTIFFLRWTPTTLELISVIWWRGGCIL